MVKPSLKQNQVEPLRSSGWSPLHWLRQTVFKSAVHPSAEMQMEGCNDVLPTAGEPARPSPPSSPPPSEPPPPTKQFAQQFAKQWQWPLVWLSAFAVLGGMGTAALVWLVSLPPQIDCRQPKQLSLDMERLYCAQEAAQTGEMAKLIAGIDLLKQWQPEHPLYGEAQRLIKEWSDQVLTLSTQRVVEGNLKGAEAALSHIPSSTPIYQEAHKSLARWRKYSKQASSLDAKAQAALKRKDWSAVSDYIVLLAAFERDYWQLEKGAGALARQLGAEKQAWQLFARAQKLADNPQQLKAAIPLAQQMPSQTYAAVAARNSLKQWSQKLVETGNQKWQKGDRLGAISALQLNSKLINQPETEDLYRFSNAYKLANSALSSRWLPTAGGLVNLAEAIAAVEHIKPDSPFHNQAQVLKKSWQAQLQNLIQLQYAGAAARFEHPAMLALAVKQAKQISPSEPCRLQAQTLIAYWQQEAERIEDQPIVDRAKQLAKGGTIASLKAAMVEAGQVDLGRALRKQSQTLIAGWRAQIQTLEDRPKLEQATDLAQQGKLDQAIATASQIDSSRALYRAAQNAIADWRYQQVVNSQIAQDQPLLDQAMAQAAAGQLSAAISTASQIGSGRALSSRAQASIRQWEIQLNPPPPSPLPNSSPEPLLPLETWDGYPLPNSVSPDTNQDYSSPLSGSPSPEASPSPLLSPLLPTEIQTVPPPGTYQPYVQPRDMGAPEQQPYPTPEPEPRQSADPLPPLDPLPPEP